MGNLTVDIILLEAMRGRVFDVHWYGDSRVVLLQRGEIENISYTRESGRDP